MYIVDRDAKEHTGFNSDTSDRGGGGKQDITKYGVIRMAKLKAD